jgi:predicted cupin superfamily sugar epimerase
MRADEIIAALGLIPHPEGGHYRETFRDADTTNGRPHSTAIYYLLRRGEKSHWHRIDAVEVWHWYAGAPLALGLSADGLTAQAHVLGPDLRQGHKPQLSVPKGHWQSAESLGKFSLVGCTVAPGFQFEGFELARPDWVPGK